MGWDIQKKMLSHVMGQFSKLAIPSHPMGHDFLKKRPMGWDGMGWDGTGWDRPIPRGALVRT
jgi:hypothetical protein